MRPSWDDYFMMIARVTALRGTCDRRRVGCVITDTSNRIICTGYNGSAPGAPHCDDSGHLMHDGHCVRTIHAEANAIAQAAFSGKSIAGGRIYVTCHPCPTCLMLISAAGIFEIVYAEDYHPEEDDISAVLAHDAMIHIRQHQVSLETVFNKLEDTGSVAAPSRYMANDRETVDRMRDLCRDEFEEMGDEVFSLVCRTHQMKYEDRAGLKGPRSVDLEKADWWGKMSAHVDNPYECADPRHSRTSGPTRYVPRKATK